MKLYCVFRLSETLPQKFLLYSIHDQEASLDDLLELHNDKFFFPPTAVIDGELLPKLPHEVVTEGGINTREIIIGANKDEGLLNTVDLLVNPDYFYDFVRNSWSTVGPMALLGRELKEIFLTSQSRTLIKLLKYLSTQLDILTTLTVNTLTTLLI